MRYLFDTSALLAHYRQEAGWQAVQALFEDIESEIFIAAPSLTEFARRMHVLGVEDDEIAAVLATYSLLMAGIVAVDGSVAKAAYDIGRRTPARLPLIDALIAAAAQAEGAVLVHRDPHLAAIPAGALAQQHLAAPDGDAPSH